MSLIRSLARKALRAVPPAQRAVFRARARRAASSIDPERPEGLPVLVYQMGKVGSASVVRTLEAERRLGRPVIAIHFLVAAQIAAARAHAERGAGRPPADRFTWLLGAAVGARLAEVGARLRIPVVTLVRDPIAREVSAAFQNRQLFARELRDADGRIDVSRATAFLRERLLGPDPCGYGEQWFDRELAATFGIDVFDEPFDRERGYQVVQSARADLLVLRTEDLDRTLCDGLAQLLGIQLAGIVRANERSASADGAAYRRVLAGLRLPRETVERIYSGRLTRHFYGKDWIERFVQRWSEPAPAEGRATASTDGRHSVAR